MYICTVPIGKKKSGTNTTESHLGRTKRQSSEAVSFSFFFWICPVRCGKGKSIYEDSTRDTSYWHSGSDNVGPTCAMI